jgi:transposase
LLPRILKLTDAKFDCTKDSWVIRSVKNHFQQYINVGKSNALDVFLYEYQKALVCCIDWIWNNSINDEKGSVCWDVSKDMLSLPKYLDYNTIDFKDSQLSSRAKSTVVNQASGIIRGSTGIKRNLINKIEWMKAKGLNTEKWQKRLDKIKISKPAIRNVSAELSSKNIDIQKSTGFFNYWIRIKSTGLPEIKIPIKLNKMDAKWIKRNGVMLGGICLGKNYIQLRYDIPEVKRTEGITVGCDTGIKTVATFSHSNPVSTADIHGHTLESINYKLARKKKGSKAFGRAQAHRTNYINWFVNSVNLDGVQQVNLEDVSGIFHGRRVPRWMKHWVHAIISGKVMSRCEELGVQVKPHDAGYYSQRCSKCGLVRKSNRKGKEYKCKGCGNCEDADLNSAINHEIDLPEIPIGVRQAKLNIKGFYWLKSGVFDLAGQELGVPDINSLKE